mmetsp:Transcript_18181/g.61041  ORF Transcript_18181/g.61041 Transcript_18181/m.61041 type:complete len:286 (-) Transcript_18181:131-988(-)
MAAIDAHDGTFLGGGDVGVGVDRSLLSEAGSDAASAAVGSPDAQAEAEASAAPCDAEPASEATSPPAPSPVPFSPPQSARGRPLAAPERVSAAAASSAASLGPCPSTLAGLALRPGDDTAAVPFGKASRRASALDASVAAGEPACRCKLWAAAAAAAAASRGNASSSPTSLSSGGGWVPVQARLTSTFSEQRAFFASDDELLGLVRAGGASLRRIPCIAVQGGNDIICPPSTAYELHEAWPEMELRVVPAGGHSHYDSGLMAELLRATDAIRDRRHSDTQAEADS